MIVKLSELTSSFMVANVRFDVRQPCGTWIVVNYVRVEEVRSLLYYTPATHPLCSEPSDFHPA